MPSASSAPAPWAAGLCQGCSSICAVGKQTRPGFPCCLPGDFSCLSCHQQAGEGEHQLPLAARVALRPPGCSSSRAELVCTCPQGAALPPPPAAGEESCACLLPSAALHRPSLLPALMLIEEVVHRSGLMWCLGGASLRAGERQSELPCEPRSITSSKRQQDVLSKCPQRLLPTDLALAHGSCHYAQHTPSTGTGLMPRPLQMPSLA